MPKKYIRRYSKGRSTRIETPGVYVKEVPSVERSIQGIPTGVAAFIGRSRKGPVDTALKIRSYEEFERAFGGHWESSTLPNQIDQFFRNGGTEAVVVRVHRPSGMGNDRAVGHLPAGPGSLVLEAISEGAWGNNVRASITQSEDLGGARFDLVLEETDSNGTAVKTEQFLGVSIVESDPRFVKLVLETDSTLARVLAPLPESPPAETNGPVEFTATGNDGREIGDVELLGKSGSGTGIYALTNHSFDLMYPSPAPGGPDPAPALWSEALAFCKRKMAMLLIDPPIRGTSAWDSPSDAIANVSVISFLADGNAAVFFPHIDIDDPLMIGSTRTISPTGSVAGVMARTDRERGVWKAPAGLEASLKGVTGLSVSLSNTELNQLNSQGVNCLRGLPDGGFVVWGSRTLAGSDEDQSEWNYISVRRFGLYLESSIDRGLQWVVFEPNGESLWAAIRSCVESFMRNHYVQGAFSGRSEAECYFVRCDSTTTTQTDMADGRVNLIVGFAPLKPAEFIVLRFSLKAAQS